MVAEMFSGFARPDALTFLLAALATFRLAYLVSQEEGPWSLATRLRGALDPDQQTWLGRGLNCVFCVSFWAAWPTLALAATSWGWWVVAGLALSSVSMLLKRWMDKR